MKRGIMIIVLIFLILLGFFFYYKKGKNDKSNTILTSKFDTNLLKLANNKDDNNVLISPYSIKMALSLLKEGSANNSLREIEKVLGENVPIINNDNIKVANALFIRDKYEKYIENEFINNLQSKYKSSVLIDEFKTPKIINDWTNKNTDGMIEKILDTISDDFTVGLANAIAIDVKWENPFECNNTTSESFVNNTGKNLKVEMMHKSYTYNVRYLESETAKGIVIPYENDTNLEFIGILPNSNIDQYVNENLEKDIYNLDNKLVSASNDLHINLSIPRFKFGYSLSNFKEVLSKMGINDVFSQVNADLTNIISRDNLAKAGIENLYVDDAIHKTFIDFNENGTRAAAITYFGVKASSAMIPSDYKEINLVFNKPFVVAIREKTTKELLFIGIINSPNLWAKQTCENLK